MKRVIGVEIWFDIYMELIGGFYESNHHHIGPCKFYGEGHLVVFAKYTLLSCAPKKGGFVLDFCTHASDLPITCRWE